MILAKTTCVTFWVGMGAGPRDIHGEKKKKMVLSVEIEKIPGLVCTGLYMILFLGDTRVSGSLEFNSKEI